MEHNYQIFNGISFREEYPGGYYIHNFNDYNERMHRYVWKFFNGEIPEGYEVHHKDFNRSNDDISNLQLLTSEEHRQLHSVMLSDAERDRRRENFKQNARPAAIEWHKSSDGSEWHKKHMAELHEKGVFKHELVCSECGKHYIGEIHKDGGNTFCSNNCKARNLRKRRKLDNSDERVCIICGKIFNCSKWSKTKTCSKGCSVRLKWVNSNEDKVSKENK